MSKSKISELICVYNSHSTMLSRAYALIGKQLLSNPCALSRLTTQGLHTRPEWQTFTSNYPVPVSCIYSDQAHADLYYVIRDKTPCVVAKCSHNQIILLLDLNNLTACNGDLGRFQTFLDTAISAKFLTL